MVAKLNIMENVWMSVRVLLRDRPGPRPRPRRPGQKVAGGRGFYHIEVKNIFKI